MVKGCPCRRAAFFWGVMMLVRVLTAYLLAAYAVVCGSLCAYGAEAILNAPETAAVGDFVLVDASDSQATRELRWTIPEKDVALFTRSDHRQIVLWSDKPRSVEVMLSAIDSNGDRKAATVVIVINGDHQPPSPAPQPKPDNPAPPDPLGIMAEMKTQAESVQTTDRPGDLRHMIKAYQQLRDDIASGKADPANRLQMRTAAQSAMGAIPKETQKRWLPGFGKWWMTKLTELYNSGKLLTREHWLTVLDLTLFVLKGLL